MKTLRRTLLLAVALLSSLSHSPAQLTGVPFLTLPRSIESIGMGGAGASLATTDALAMAENPGALGVFGLTNTLSASTYMTKADWLPQYPSNPLTYTLRGVNAGYNFKNILSTPFEIGVSIGYARQSLELDSWYYWTPTPAGGGIPPILGLLRQLLSWSRHRLLPPARRGCHVQTHRFRIQQ
jgi:hypothetical protein